MNNAKPLTYVCLFGRLIDSTLAVFVYLYTFVLLHTIHHVVSEPGREFITLFVLSLSAYDSNVCE